jgi:hypothetical protein
MLWVMLMIMTFWVVKCSSIANVVGFNLDMIILQKQNENLKFMKTCILLSCYYQTNFLNKIYRIVVLHLHKDIIMNQSHDSWFMLLLLLLLRHKLTIFDF